MGTAAKLAPSEIVNVVLGTAGHIDHGKSSVVRRLTGIDPDRLPEEQERGMTIDLGFAPFKLADGRRVGIIDVPGHERFIKNMVAGATGIDLVMLVVAADDGIMPQTREHLSIMTLLGLKRGFVAINKIDLVEPDMLDLVEEEVRSLVAGTFLEGAPILRVSAATGQGFDRLGELINTMVREASAKRTEGLFRMPIQRIFSAKGFGTVVTGVPLTGKLKIGDPIEILPKGLRGRVRHLQAYKCDVPEVRAGHSSAINVGDVAHAEVLRGDVAATPGAFAGVTCFEAHVRVLGDVTRPLRHLMSVRVHVGTKEAVGRLALLEHPSMAAGSDGFVQLRLEEPVVVAPGDPFILRLQSPLVTLGGGQIVDASGVRQRRFQGEKLAFYRRALAAADDVRTRVELELERGHDLTTEEALAKAAGAQPPVVREVVERLRAAGTVRPFGAKGVVHVAAMARARARLIAYVERFHVENPIRAGVPKRQVVLEAGVAAELVEPLLAEAAAKGELAVENERVRRPDHVPKLSREEQEAMGALESRLQAGRFSPPNEQDLFAGMKLPAERLAKVLGVLVEKGQVLSLADGVYMHVEAMQEARRLIVLELEARGSVEPGRVKELLATTRKFVIPILEHLDQVGVTQRVENRRVLRGKP